jgi:hypothetical protein
MAATPHYPTFAEINALKREFIREPNDPWYEMALARERRGQVWNKTGDGPATWLELTKGIGATAAPPTQDGWHRREARLEARVLANLRAGRA